MKITYDLNNKKECEEIETYYFFKYYLESLLFDWKKTIDKVITDNNINLYYDAMMKDPPYYDKQLDNILSSAIKHLNHLQFKKARDVYSKILFPKGKTYEYNDEKYALLHIIYGAEVDIELYRNYLKKTYGEKH